MLLKNYKRLPAYIYLVLNYLTPFIQLNSSDNVAILTVFGTPSNIIIIESFIIVIVVKMTIIENTKVQIGSTILASGYKD